MWKIHDELWECDICGSIVRRDQIEGACNACRKRTCVYCYRVCERCQRTFCFNHVRKAEVWRQGTLTRMLLCEKCEDELTVRIEGRADEVLHLHDVRESNPNRDELLRLLQVAAAKFHGISW